MGVRRNAARLLPIEKSNFVDALIKLKTTKRSSTSALTIYDEFVAIHVAACWLVKEGGVGWATGNNAHNGSAFLPWHREFLRRFELELQKIDASITIPYWNWGFGNGIKQSDPWETNSIFTDDFMGPGGSIEDGLPGGTPDDGLPVRTGFVASDPTPSNTSGWKCVSELDNDSTHLPEMQLMTRLQSYGSKLRRKSDLTASTLDTRTAGWTSLSKLESILKNKTYNEFRENLETFPHNLVHGTFIGGNMMFMTSPEDPIFWLHHSQVDRLWAIWQSTYGHNQRSDYQLHSPIVGRPTSDLNGHGLTDLMWPWDGGKSLAHIQIRPLLPTFATTDKKTVESVLDIKSLGYSYDTTEMPPHPPRAKDGH